MFDRHGRVLCPACGKRMRIVECDTKTVPAHAYFLCSDLACGHPSLFEWVTTPNGAPSNDSPQTRQ